MIELENIDGIGPKTKELLNKLKIYNGDDLLYYNSVYLLGGDFYENET